MRYPNRSTDEPEVEADLVNVEFDNRGCDCAWRLYWLDESGARHAYGRVPPNVSHVQGTFPGHVLKLEADTGSSAAALKELRYAAVKGACVAPVRDDASCQRAELSREADGSAASGRAGVAAAA